MAKKLVSFRMEEHRIEELRELANVYTNGNATDLIEHLIRRMYFLEPLALLGKYRTPGFGITGEDRKRIKSAWDVWINESIMPAKPKIKTPIVYTHGRKTQLSERAIKEICEATGIAYNPNMAFNIHAYWG